MSVGYVTGRHGSLSALSKKLGAHDRYEHSQILRPLQEKRQAPENERKRHERHDCAANSTSCPGSVRANARGFRHFSPLPIFGFKLTLQCGRGGRAGQRTLLVEHF